MCHLEIACLENTRCNKEKDDLGKVHQEQSDLSELYCLHSHMMTLWNPRSGSFYGRVEKVWEEGERETSWGFNREK